MQHLATWGCAVQLKLSGIPVGVRNQQDSNKGGAVDLQRHRHTDRASAKEREESDRRGELIPDIQRIFRTLNLNAPFTSPRRHTPT